MQEADGNRADAGALKPRGQTAKAGGGGRAQHGAVGVHPLLHAEAQRAFDEKAARRGREVIQLRTILAADFEQILEPGGGDESGARALAFQQRVGGDGGSVDHVHGRVGQVSDLPSADARSIPARITCAGARGLDGSLKLSRPPSSRSTTKSVNVPPASTPMRMLTDCTCAPCAMMEVSDLTPGSLQTI